MVVEEEEEEVRSDPGKVGTAGSVGKGWSGKASASADSGATNEAAVETAPSAAGARNSIHDLNGPPLVLCIRPLSDERSVPDVFELHDAHLAGGVGGSLHTSSLIRLRHVASGGWLASVNVRAESSYVPPATAALPTPSTAASSDGEGGFGAGNGFVMAAIRADCTVRDGLLIERPLPVTQTFLAVSGVTQHLLSFAREIEADVHGIAGAGGPMEERPFTSACLTYLSSYLSQKDDDENESTAARISVVYLQDMMRELGVLAALITLLTIPFERLGTVAFHHLGFDKPLLPQSKLAANLLYHCIEDNATNCTVILPAVPQLEPAARKGIGIGEVLQEVFAEVPVDTSQMDFWFDLLAKARRGTASDPDYTGGSIILSLLHAFCLRHSLPLISNQNLIATKLILSPASAPVERFQVVTAGQLAERPSSPSAAHPSGGRSTPGAIPGGGGGAAAAAATTPHSDRSSARRKRDSRERGGSSSPVLSTPVDGSTVSAETTAPQEDDSPEGGPPRSLLSAFREASLTPLRSMTKREAAAAAARASFPGQPPKVEAVEMLNDVLEHPALLCVVSRMEVAPEAAPEARKATPASQGSFRGRSSTPGKKARPATTRVLCLSSTDPRKGTWTPLSALHFQPGLLTYYLAELKLIGGLCCGVRCLQRSHKRL